MRVQLRMETRNFTLSADGERERLFALAAVVDERASAQRARPGLRGGEGVFVCAGADGAFESTLVGGTPFELKTNFCEVEPFTTHRRCLQLVMAKYFPPK